MVIFILLHMHVKILQHHLLKKLSLFIVCSATFVKNQLMVDMWVYLSIYYPVSGYLSVFMSILCCFEFIPSAFLMPYTDLFLKMFISSLLFCMLLNIADGSIL